MKELTNEELRNIIGGQKSPEQGVKSLLMQTTQSKIDSLIAKSGELEGISLSVNQAEIERFTALKNEFNGIKAKGNGLFSGIRGKKSDEKVTTEQLSFLETLQENLTTKDERTFLGKMRNSNIGSIIGEVRSQLMPESATIAVGETEVGMSVVHAELLGAVKTV